MVVEDGTTAPLHLVVGSTTQARILLSRDPFLEVGHPQQSSPTVQILASVFCGQKNIRVCLSGMARLN